MVKKIGLLSKLILGITLGIIIGLLSKSLEVYIIVRLLSTFTGLFGNLLSFIIPFIIIGFVAPGIADLGKGASKLLSLTAAIAYFSAITAGTLAFFIGSTILPSVIKASELIKQGGPDLSPYFTIEIPAMMGVMTALVTAFVLGIGMANIKGKSLFKTLQDFQHVIELVVKYVLIPLIPFHIAGIFAKLTTSGEIFRTIRSFSSVFILILLLQLSYIVIQYTIAWLLSGKNPFTCIKNMLPAYFTALGTQSSAATIPVTLQSARNNDISDDIVDFVIPLGATIHLAGDTITLVLASMGVMLISGQIPTFANMFPFILMLGVTMVAAPGIPGGGVYAALGLLENMLLFSQPQQGLMIALHFAQDSFGTATNVTGDGAIAIMIDTIANKRKKSR